MNTVVSDHSSTASVNQRRNANDSNDEITINTGSGGGNVCSIRRLSHPYQSQLPHKSNADDIILLSAGRYSPHPNEIFMQQPTNLTISTLEKFDDVLINNCLTLPPPSPAPNGDCLSTSISQSSHNHAHAHSHIYNQAHSKTPNQLQNKTALGHTNQIQQLNLSQFQQQSHCQGQAQIFPLSSSNSTSSLCTSSGSTGENTSMLHKQHGKYNNQHQQRTMSPNSVYRLERYRESLSIQKSNLSSSPAPSSASSGCFFLPPKAIVQCDAYSGYLGSTVHTPIKRYVPTPPPVSDLYTDLALSTSTTISSTPLSTSSSQYVTMPLSYNYRAKCCHNDELSQGIYSKCSQTYNLINVSSASSSSTSSTCPCPISNSNPSLSRAPSGIPGPAVSNICSPIVSTAINMGSCNKVRAPSAITNSDDSESIIVMHATANSQSQSQNTIGTCLHCNTARRTTGVHQTTQTTGPISPVPVTISHVPNLDLGKELQLPTHATNSITFSPAIIESSNVISPQQQTPKFISENTSSVVTYRQPHQQQQLYGSPHISPRLPQCHIQHLQQHQQQQQSALPQQQLGLRYSCKKRISIYIRRRVAQFFGVEATSEVSDFSLWYERHQRLAVRRFGPIILNSDLDYNEPVDNRDGGVGAVGGVVLLNNIESSSGGNNYYVTDRPDILPAQDNQNIDIMMHNSRRNCKWRKCYSNNDFNGGEFIERKATVVSMLMTSVSYLINIFHKRLINHNHGHVNSTCKRRHRQWSRSFAPVHVSIRPELDLNEGQSDLDAECTIGMSDSLTTLTEVEVFFDNFFEGSSHAPNDENTEISRETKQSSNISMGLGLGLGVGVGVGVGLESVYMAERHHNGWRTSALNGNVNNDINLIGELHSHHVDNVHLSSSGQTQPVSRNSNLTTLPTNRGTRIVAQLLDGVLENSRRPQMRRIKYFSINDIDDRTDHRPFFTYWINTVQIIVLILSIICYGIAPIGFGSEQKTGQVLVTSLSLQTVQYVEQRNLWIGPRNNDLVHMGAKFAACMRRDVKIMEVLSKTRKRERETACCIRNDDSGCVQSSQADCSIRGLYPTKSISTWKKWSPGESGPGGRISGSVCGLDPKFCDAPASIAPYEWPDDITKWPICRKTNSFSQRYRYKDHTAEHMVCEVIGHPCCTGLYGECRITTREYCDFVNGYFHEEASLCSQISCLTNVCGMFSFISVEIPDQIYRLLTSLCMHAGVLHLAVTLVFQHLFLSDLERLIGTLRTCIVYIISGLAGNLTSAVLLPHRPEVGPSASLCGVISSLAALLIWMHWRFLRRPYVALFKLLLLSTVLFGIGTLPYQLNFVGLLAGVACGAFLTISLVPFATFTKYGRKNKINLIWTCIMLHLFVYASLIAIFYIYPSEFSSFNFVDDIFEGTGNSFIKATNNNIGHHNVEIASSTTRRYLQNQRPQYYYHLHPDDIIRSNMAYSEDTHISDIYPKAQRQKGADLWQNGVYISYNANNSDRIYRNRENSLISTNELKIKKTLISPILDRLLYNTKKNSRIKEASAVDTKLNRQFHVSLNNTFQRL